MTIDWIGILGTIAGIATSVAVWPQVLKAHRTRSTQDLSYKSLIMCLIELMLWGFYGWAVQDWIICSAAFIASLGYADLIDLKHKYESNTWILNQ